MRELRLAGDTSPITAPGQFVNVRIDGLYLRRPISVCDWDGDGQDDYICGSEFITQNDIGIRFENRGSSLRAEYTQGGDMDLGGACTFNALFVRWALAEGGGPYLDHLLTAERPDDPDGTW